MENDNTFEREKKAEKSVFEGLIEEVDESRITPLEFLNASNDKAAKAEFMADESLVHPRNEYGNLDVDKVVGNINRLNDVLSEVEQLKESDALSSKEERLLKLISNKYEKQNEFVLANYAYQIADTPEKKEKAKNWHQKVNKELYGEVDRSTFFGLMKEKLSSIHPETPEEEADFQRLKESIGPIPDGEANRFKPKDETVERFSEIVNDFFGGFLEHVKDDKDNLSSEEVVDTINEILDEELEGGYGYKAVIDERAANASVSQKLIKFPEGKTYPISRAKALICHELGTHVMRAIPFLGHEIPVFSKGFPKNMDFDEGVAKCIEQAINGKYEDSGIDHYLNIGMATYLNKNFREVYETQNLMKKLTHSSNEKVIVDVQRCFRGTGELPNNKDLAYFNGSNQVWKYIEEHIDDPELMDNLFLSGQASMDHDEQQFIYEAKTGGI